MPDFKFFQHSGMSLSEPDATPAERCHLTLTLPGCEVTLSGPVDMLHKLAYGLQRQELSLRVFVDEKSLLVCATENVALRESLWKDHNPCDDAHS